MTHNTIIAVQFGEGLSPGNNTSYLSPPRAVSERVQGVCLEGFTATLSISHKRRRCPRMLSYKSAFANNQSLRDQDLAIPFLGQLTRLVDCIDIRNCLANMS